MVKVAVAEQNIGFFARPAVGTVLAVLSGLSFMFLAMCLPLVGPAGATVPYARANQWTFLAVLFVAMVLAVLAVVSKLERRKLDQSPLPYASIGLVVLYAVLLVAVFGGLLRI